MKKYKHRKDGYIVEALKAPEAFNDCYRVYGYRCCGRPPAADWFVNIAVKDFIELFEPIEEYCSCDNFKWHAERGFFAENDAGKWVSWLHCSNRRCPDGMPRVKSPIEYCQFCGKKPL